MVLSLIDLCEDTIEILKILKFEDLITDDELECHLELKIKFVEDFK